MRKEYVKPEVKLVVGMLKWAPLIMASRDVLQGTYDGKGKYSSMGFGGESSSTTDLWGSREDNYDDDDNYDD